MLARTIVYTIDGREFYGDSAEMTEKEFETNKELYENFFENNEFKKLNYIKIYRGEGVLYFHPDNIIGVELEKIEYE